MSQENLKAYTQRDRIRKVNRQTRRIAKRNAKKLKAY